MTLETNNEVKGTLLGLFKDAATIAGGAAVLLTVAGFLVLRSHAAVLGLDSLLHHSITDYASQGGAFLLTVLLWALPTLATRLLFWAVLLALAVYIYLDGAPEAQWRIRNWLTLGRRIEAWPLSVTAAALATGFALWRLLPSPEAVDLLFATGDQSEIALRATELGTQQLKADFLDGLLAALAAGALLFLAWRSLPACRHGFPPAVRVLLIGLGILLVLLLPVQYGQTIFSNDFHRIESYALDPEAQKVLPASREVWLLGHSSEGFVFYFRDSFTVSLVAKDALKQLSVGERRNIFAPAVP